MLSLLLYHNYLNHIVLVLVGSGSMSPAVSLRMDLLTWSSRKQWHNRHTNHWQHSLRGWPTKSCSLNDTEGSWAASDSSVCHDNIMEDFQLLHQVAVTAYHTRIETWLAEAGIGDDAIADHKHWWIPTLLYRETNSRFPRGGTVGQSVTAWRGHRLSAAHDKPHETVSLKRHYTGTICYNDGCHPKEYTNKKTLIGRCLANH